MFVYGSDCCCPAPGQLMLSAGRELYVWNSWRRLDWCGLLIQFRCLNSSIVSRFITAAYAVVHFLMAIMWYRVKPDNSINCIFSVLKNNSIAYENNTLASLITNRLLEHSPFSTPTFLFFFFFSLAYIHGLKCIDELLLFSIPGWRTRILWSDCNFSKWILLHTSCIKGMQLRITCDLLFSFWKSYSSVCYLVHLKLKLQIWLKIYVYSFPSPS